jgi:hypothetical protein
MTQVCATGSANKAAANEEARASRAPAPAKRRRRSLTAKTGEKFLEALGAGWSISHAAELTGHSRQRFYEEREPRRRLRCSLVGGKRASTRSAALMAASHARIYGSPERRTRESTADWRSCSSSCRPRIPGSNSASFL